VVWYLLNLEDFSPFRTEEILGGMEVKLHAFLTLELETNGYILVPTALLLEWGSEPVRNQWRTE
jgi:hypothetical protein